MNVQRMPKIYNIPPSLPFADTLAKGIIEKYGSDPLALADVILLLPNRRSCRSLQEAFLRVTDGKPTLLPKMQPLGDVGDEDFTLKISLGAINSDLPPVISGSRQRLLLANLVEKWQNANVGNKKTSAVQCVNLAVDLATFLDEVQRQQLPFDKLQNIVPEELAKHWQITLDFMDIIIRLWPEILQEKGAMDIGNHRNVILGRLSKYWQETMPQTPIIAAGSTGSIPATAELLKIISKLPNGAVVLPGLDQIMDETSWENIAESSPQFGLKNLLENMGVERGAVMEWKLPLPVGDSWGEGLINNNPHPDSTEILEEKISKKPALSHRERESRSILISQMMQPFEVSYKWQDIKEIPDEAIKGISRIDAATLQDEAKIIALIFRHTLETEGKTAALVTNDSSLAMRVKGIMVKWDIKLDNSGGTPLSQVPACVFMRLISRMVEEKMAPVNLLACLKHPMACAGGKVGNFKIILREIEKKVFRGVRVHGGIPGIKAALEEDARPTENQAKFISLLDNIENILKPFTHLMQQKTASLHDIITSHIKVAENLAATDELSGATHIWGNDEGLALKEFFEELLEASSELEQINPPQYTGVLEALLVGKTYRPKYGSHPRIAILSPMEARMQGFDLVILGGLNEGSWPPAVEAGAWMSRPMRKSFGLPLPEKQIGQSAHDFVQLLHAPNVILTRSEKVDGTATIASRWLMRLDAVLGICSKQKMLEPEFPWDIWARELDRPEYILPCNPPAPKPPVSSRPIEISVTQVEKLMSNPYAHYADKILRLKRLDPIDMETGNREFGDIIHKVIEGLVAGYDAIPPNGRMDFLLDNWRKLLDKNHIPLAVRAFWQPRFENIATEFLQKEQERRKELAKVIGEVKGAYNINLEDGREFKVTARADRLELTWDNKITIIDYKTKSTISAIANGVMNGTLPQMPLEALMANNSGFEGIEGQIQDMEYWFMTGGNDKSNAINIETISAKLSKVGSIEQMLENTKDGIAELAQVFTKETTPYLSCPDPDNEPDFNDYKHLARHKEW